MTRVEFHPEAETELADAVSFYDAERPQAGSPLRPNLRRWLVRRFPYSPIYRDDSDRLYVLAIAHHRRKPRYWDHRS